MKCGPIAGFCPNLRFATLSVTSKHAAIDSGQPVKKQVAVTPAQPVGATVSRQDLVGVIVEQIEDGGSTLSLPPSLTNITEDWSQTGAGHQAGQGIESL